MPTWVVGLAMIGGGVLISVLGLLFVRRRFPADLMEKHHEVAGFIYGVVGVIYAVLLAFVVIIVWEHYAGAEATVSHEASCVSDLFRVSAGLPESQRSELRQAMRTYAKIVVKDEWPAMGRGAESRHAVEAVHEMWRVLVSLRPSTSEESNLQTVAIGILKEMNDQRRSRMLASRKGVPLVLWLALYSGAVVTILFSYFFGVKNLVAQCWMTGLLAWMIFSTLFLISALDYPFTGDVRVRPEAFEYVIEHMKLK